MTSRSSLIIDLDAEPEAKTGADRRRALALGFALCLAVGSEFVGRDSPVATSPSAGPADVTPLTTFVYDRTGGFLLFVQSGATLSLPPTETDVQFQVFPDWLANEQLSPMIWMPVPVRAGSGLAVEAVRPGDPRIVTWTELGTVYWLISEQRDIPDLIRLANSLR